MRSLALKDGSRIRWAMLVSHHAPCDNDRTLSLFGLRVCVRCLGMFGGVLAGCWIKVTMFGVPHICLVMCGLGLTLPAAFDFAAHELSKKYRSTNFRRLVTGGLFGIVVGVYLAFAWQGIRWPLFCLLAYLALLELAIAGLFRKCGHLDSYIARYEASLYKDEGNRRTTS